MINPNDVNLIIFDTDGTITPSLQIVYTAIKRAFAKLGWAVEFSQEDISKFFGMPSASASDGGIYKFITPPESHLSWTEVRDKVREEYVGSFRESGETFPKVRETFTTLRKRGYKLALYSNASTQYFETVIDALDIRGYFDYTECVIENNLTKTELVRKIKNKFNNIIAAVVGDRFHDIDAARDTGSLSVGALFGYGGDEPEKADTTIASFDDLLRIFDRRLPIFGKIQDKVRRRKSTDSPFVIGITGVDCSGKTFFAAGLEDYLKQKGLVTQQINLDDFHQPRGIRHATDADDEDYYERIRHGLVFDFQRLIDELLAPISQNKFIAKTLTLLDLQSDEFSLKKRFNIGPDTIVILEGVYLFLDSLIQYIDYKVFLDVPFDAWRERARVRDPEEVFARYETRYLPAQRKYLAQYPPSKIADMIVDNTNWEHPQITTTRL